MLQHDDIHPALQDHAARESELQATMAPPVPMNGEAAATAPAAAPAPAMVQ
jgi:hypothetical protein